MSTAPKIEPITGVDRRCRRSKLFVAVSLIIEGKTYTARLRDISPMGALLELRDPPLSSASVTLVRRDLKQSGVVKWVKNNRCGLAFDEEVSLLDWIAGVPSRGQVAVDDQIAAVRNGVGSNTSCDRLLNDDEAINSILSERISQEIDFVARTLEDFSVGLAQDRKLVIKYSKGLQRLDEASRILAELSAMVNIDNPATRAKDCSLSSLRSRLLRT